MKIIKFIITVILIVGICLGVPCYLQNSININKTQVKIWNFLRKSKTKKFIIKKHKNIESVTKNINFFQQFKEPLKKW